MNIDMIFNKFGGVNPKSLKKYESYIIENSGEIDHLNPTSAQRAKYIKFKPNTLYCNCGEYLQFSSFAGEVFKKTCGNKFCVPLSYNRDAALSKFKQNINNRQFDKIKQFSIEDQTKYAQEYLSLNKAPNYFASEQIDICKFIKLQAKKLKMKTTQYFYHLIHFNGDMTLPKTRFLSFDKGYRNDEIKEISTKEERKIKSKLELFEKFNYTVIKHSPINKSAWLIRCDECKTTFTKWFNNGYAPCENMCINCFPKNKSSLEFQLIEDIKKVYDGEVIHTYRLENSFNKNSYKSIDIYIPEFKFGIEINGIYWHQDQKYKHIEKKKLCEDLGIDLVQFTDFDILEKYSIVLSMIRNKIGLSQRFFARKCVIEEIDISTYRDFLENNHIKGYSSANIKLGAFYGTNLISVFSLSKSRFKKNEIELIRFCHKKDVINIGMLSKFINFIKKNYDINEINTFVDLHYGNGNSYEKVGFELLYTTRPNYFYFKSGKCYSRLNFQKHKLKKDFPEVYNDSLTEIEIMKELGYMIYYDCGNKKLKYLI
jgi:hypothetical protein